LCFSRRSRPGERLDRPEVRVVLDRVAAHLVEDEPELLGLVVPPGVLGPGLCDDQEQFGVGDVLLGVARVGVRLHEPPHLLLGGRDVAPVAEVPCPYPPGEEVLLVFLDCGLGVGRAASSHFPCENARSARVREERCVAGVNLQPRIERVGGPRVLAGLAVDAGQPDERGDRPASRP
jgi:hypothetical protein